MGGFGGNDDDIVSDDSQNADSNNSEFTQGHGSEATPSGDPTIFDIVSGAYDGAGFFLNVDGSSDEDKSGEDDGDKDDSDYSNIEHVNIDSDYGIHSHGPDLSGESDRLEDYLSDGDDDYGADFDDDPALSDEEFNEYLEGMSGDGLGLPLPERYGDDRPDMELPEK